MSQIICYFFCSLNCFIKLLPRGATPSNHCDASVRNFHTSESSLKDPLQKLPSKYNIRKATMASIRTNNKDWLILIQFILMLHKAIYVYVVRHYRKSTLNRGNNSDNFKHLFLIQVISSLENQSLIWLFFQLGHPKR